MGSHKYSKISARTATLLLIIPGAGDPGKEAGRFSKCHWDIFCGDDLLKKLQVGGLDWPRLVEFMGNKIGLGAKNWESTPLDGCFNGFLSSIS